MKIAEATALLYMGLYRDGGKKVCALLESDAELSAEFRSALGRAVCDLAGARKYKRRGSKLLKEVIVSDVRRLYPQMSKQNRTLHIKKPAEAAREELRKWYRLTDRQFDRIIDSSKRSRVSRKKPALG